VHPVFGRRRPSGARWPDGVIESKTRFETWFGKHLSDINGCARDMD
jgi:hypothetical protein